MWCGTIRGAGKVKLVNVVQVLALYRWCMRQLRELPLCAGKVICHEVRFGFA